MNRTELARFRSMDCDNGTMSDLEQHVIAAASAAGTFERVECDPELADTAAFCAHYGFLPSNSANTIVVATKSDEPQYAACVVLATHRLDVNGTVRRRLGARKVSFAPPEATAAVTGMVMGGVTPFGLPVDLPLWIDADVAQRTELIVGGGSRSLKLLVPPATLLALPNAELVEGLARPIE